MTRDNLHKAVEEFVRADSKDRFGSVPGLDDEELADPAEIERVVLRQMWEPILSLPVQHSSGTIRGRIDEDGGVDFGAFGTVDFERYSGGFDKARYKADKLKERLKDLIILLRIVSERVPARVRGKVFRYVKIGPVELDRIVDDDVRTMAELCLRIRRLRRQISDLQKRSFERQRQRLRAWLKE